MAAPTFTPAQREANLLKVSDLYLTGKTQAHIAGVIGCSQQQVSSYLKKLYKRWEAAATANIDRRKAIELSRLDKVEAEAWSAWERSQRDAETETVTTTKDTTISVNKREGQTGDPRFLDVVNKCIAQRCRIIGIEAPQKVDLRDWRDEAKAQGYDPDQLIDEFARAMVAGHMAGSAGKDSNVRNSPDPA